MDVRSHRPHKHLFFEYQLVALHLGLDHLEVVGHVQLEVAAQAADHVLQQTYTFAPAQRTRPVSVLLVLPDLLPRDISQREWVKRETLYRTPPQARMRIHHSPAV